MKEPEPPLPELSSGPVRNSNLASQGIILSLIIAAGACSDAPRENPFDPLSPSFRNVAALSGLVIVRNLGTGISRATVACLGQGIIAETDVNGYFSFPQVGAGSVTLVCSREGFVPDSQRVHLEPGESLQTSFSLNGMPVVSDQRIVTHKYDQYYPSPQYFVDLMASVTDPNGIADIDSVWFRVDTLSFPMLYSISSRQFETSIHKYDLPTNSIQWLVGKALVILSKDREGAVGSSAPFHVTRIIEDAPTPTYPTSINNDTTGPQPILKWTSPNLTFSYSYTVEIARVDAGAETNLWTRTAVSSLLSQIQFTVDNNGKSLAPGDYVWRVSVVDDFGNSSRSKGANFAVK